MIRAGIRSYDEQAFDNMSEESEKKNNLRALSLINRCGLFQLKAVLSRLNKMVN